MQRSPPPPPANNGAKAALRPSGWANAVEWKNLGNGNKVPTEYLTSDGLYYVRDNVGKARTQNLRYIKNSDRTIAFSHKEFFNQYPGQRPEGRGGRRRLTRKNRTRRRSTRKNRGRQMKKNRKIAYKN